jgi:3-oxoacyl-[acyl-carrier-protein] synthase II
MVPSQVVSQQSHHLRRVVVTGLGAVTPLGLTFHDTLNLLLEGSSSGVTSLEDCFKEATEQEREAASKLPCQVAAPVRLFTRHDDFKSPRFVAFSQLAANEALEQAKLNQEFFASSPNLQYRTGVSMGVGMSSVRQVLQAANARQPSPHFVPSVLANSAAGRISLENGFKGPNLTMSTACAAAAHAIGDASRQIQWNHADVMLAGGAEASLDPLSLNGFCRMRALSTNYNDRPELASRPFDANRDGFVMGEGAAVLVLEELEHAIRRNATILAELVGYGATADAYHSTAPHPDGDGAFRAMQLALQGHDSESVGYINAHATSTPKGDEVEARTIDRLFFETHHRAAPLYVSSTKGATGHLLGAAGAIEAAFTVQALVDRKIPPTLNLTQPEEGFGFQLPSQTTVVNELELALSNSFGFGGTNASLLFKRWCGE